MKHPTPFQSCTVYAECIQQNLHYTYLLVHTRDNETEFPSPHYGVKIILKLDDQVYENESCALFCERDRALTFLAYLHQNLVTPSNLPYVIEDALLP